MSIAHYHLGMLHLRFGRSVELHLDTDLIPPRSRAMEDVLAAMAENMVPILSHVPRCPGAQVKPEKTSLTPSLVFVLARGDTMSRRAV